MGAVPAHSSTSPVLCLPFSFYLPLLKKPAGSGRAAFKLFPIGSLLTAAEQWMSSSCPQVRTAGTRLSPASLPCMGRTGAGISVWLGLACCFLEVYLGYFSCRVFGTSRAFDSMPEPKAAV